MTMTGDVQIYAGDIAYTGTRKEYALGSRGVTEGGAIYRYARAGAVALAPGKLTVASTIVANHENIAVAAAAAAGASEVTVTLGATEATLNQYADGYLVVNDAAGEGTAYRISGHPAADASASLTVKLSDDVRVALTTSSEVTLLANEFADIVISAADQADKAAGIPNNTIPAGEFGWVQTQGVCSALADEALAIGSTCTIGSSVAGALEVADLIGEQAVAVAIQAGVDTEYRAVSLILE